MSEKENIKIEIPFELKFQNVKNEIYTAINSAYSNGIPFYLLEPIVSDILHQVQQGARLETEAASKSYQEALLASTQDKSKNTSKDTPVDDSSEEVPKE